MPRTKVKLKSSLRTNKILLRPGDVIEIDAQTALRYVRLGIAEPLPEQVEASLVSASAPKAASQDVKPESVENKSVKSKQEKARDTK